MAIIENGGNGGGYKAKVTKGGRLDTSSRSNPRIYYVSRDKGQAFSWHSTYSVGGTGEEILYIKNTSDTLKLFIDDVIVGGAVAAVFELRHETSGTAAGTTITGKNLNLGSGNVATATSFGNASVTGSLDGDIIASERVQAGDSKDFKTNDAIFLGKNDAVFIRYVGSAGVAEASIFGYFEEVNGN
jgi:hypothetical protein